jgi:hypothetical protein
MPRYQSAALREERANLLTSLQTIFTAAETESRDLTPEETQEASRIETRFTAASTELRQLELVEGYSPEQRAAERNIERNGGPAEQRGVGVARTASTATRSWIHSLGTGDTSGDRVRAPDGVRHERVAINGGYNVPQSWADGIRDILVDIGVIRSLASARDQHRQPDQRADRRHASGRRDARRGRRDLRLGVRGHGRQRPARRLGRLPARQDLARVPARRHQRRPVHPAPHRPGHRRQGSARCFATGTGSLEQPKGLVRPRTSARPPRPPRRSPTPTWSTCSTASAAPTATCRAPRGSSATPPAPR